MACFCYHISLGNRTSQTDTPGGWTTRQEQRQSHSRDRYGGKSIIRLLVKHTQAHKHASTQTEEERDQLTLSSFTCDVIEAEQQTLKPEAELRSSTAARNYRLHSRSARTHISTSQRVETKEDDTMHVNHWAAVWLISQQTAKSFSSGTPACWGEFANLSKRIYDHTTVL